MPGILDDREECKRQHSSGETLADPGGKRGEGNQSATAVDEPPDVWEKRTIKDDAKTGTGWTATTEERGDRIIIVIIAEMGILASKGLAGDGGELRVWMVFGPKSPKAGAPAPRRVEGRCQWCA